MTGTRTALPPDLAAALAARPELADIEVRHFPVLASTNDTAGELVESGAADGTVVIADRQRAGRGRRGRVWDSPPGAGLYLSVVLRGRQSPVLTLLAGVAVAEAVQATAGAAVELKWPNDVVAPAAGEGAGVPPLRKLAGGPPLRRLAGGPPLRKLAGILTEALPGATERDAAVVVGIGVNVRSRAFPDELAGRATTVESLARRRVDGWVLCAELLVRLGRWRRRMAAEGEGFVIARWRALAPGSRGAAVSWDVDGTSRRGVTAGVDDTGALLVSCGGRTERIVGGEVRWD